MGKPKSKAVTAAKINLKNNKPASVITAAVIGCILIQDIVFIILKQFGINANGPDNMTVSLGNYLFLLIILSAVFIPAMNFRKTMNLGAKRSDFFFGCAVIYAVMAAFVSLLSVILYYTYDKFAVSQLYGGGTLDVLYWFGWVNDGAVMAFFRQFAFLLLFAVVIHTLVSVQGKWYGWAADISVAAVISVFTPIAPLRAALVWFLRLIIFHQNAFLQTAACLIFAVAIYSLNKFIYARKAI